jgi:hypothetical protein
MGSAAVGALLQAQLSTKLTAAAARDSAALPAPQRGTFLDKFHDAATGNLDIGNANGGFKFPAGTPAQVQELATKVFGEGFVNAMRVTLWLPIVVLAVGALAVLLVRNGATRGAAEAPEGEGAESPVAAVGG